MQFLELGRGIVVSSFMVVLLCTLQVDFPPEMQFAKKNLKGLESPKDRQQLGDNFGLHRRGQGLQNSEKG